MFYKVIEVSNHTDSGFLYLKVAFWSNRGDFILGRPSVVLDDFILGHLQQIGRRIITDALGRWKRKSDGQFIDPTTLPINDLTEWDREDFAVDVKADIQRTILAFWQTAQAKGWTGDRTTRGTRDVNDPRGFLARPDIQSLRGAEVDIP